MAAAAVMVVSSQQRHDRPKLAPKPSPATKQLETVRQASQPPQPRPLRSQLARLELFGTRETEKVYQKRQDSEHHRCVNQTSTCEICRNSDNRPVNIDSVILRRGRRAKAPKPLPYLEPIVTYLAARSDRQPTVGGRSPSVAQQRIRKRVTFAASAQSRPLRQRRVGRAHSARGRRKELAYLVVDLESGTITSCSEEQSESRAESLGVGTSLRRSVTFADTDSRERAMSTGAATKPVPLPRRIKTVASPAEKDCTTSAPQPSNEDQRETSTASPVPLPRSPVMIPTPEREVEGEPSTTDSSISGHSDSLVFQRKMALEKRETSPPRPRSRSTTPSDVKPRPRSQNTVQSSAKPPPPVRTCSVLTYNVPTQQSQPPVSDSHTSDDPSTPPTLPPKSPPHHTPTFRPKSPPHHIPTVPPKSSPHHAPTLPPKSPPHHAPTFPPKSPPHHAPTLPPKSSPHHAPTLPPKSPPHHTPPHRGPDSTPPPPIPAKSELSRIIQSSIKGRREPPSQPKPSDETPDPLELTESLDTTQNYSYGATVLSDGSSGGYEISDPEFSTGNNPDMEEDRPEDLYIDPTLSKEFSSTGKPRPPRPPPPSSRALKKAQRRKTQSRATSTVALKNKQLTKQHFCSDAHKASTIQQHKRSKSPLISSRSTTACSKSQENIEEQLYEELDIESSLPQTPILWRPPSAANTSSSAVAPGRGAADKAGTKTLQPSLPPRAEKPTTQRKTHRPNDHGTKKSTPGEVTRSKSIGDLHAPRNTRQVSPSVPRKEDKVDDLELDSADEYEPLEDTVPVAPQEYTVPVAPQAYTVPVAPQAYTVPVAPQRTKKNIKGTLVTSPNRAPGNIYNQNSPQDSPQSGTKRRYEPRRTAPVAPPLQNNRGEQGNKSPLTTTKSPQTTTKSPQTATKSPQTAVKPPVTGRRKSTGQGKNGKGNGSGHQKDEGGVEDYVDMDYKPAKDDDEDGPDVYVDMQPNKKIADTQEVNDELSDPLRPYLRT